MIFMGLRYTDTSICGELYAHQKNKALPSYANTSQILRFWCGTINTTSFPPPIPDRLQLGSHGLPIRGSHQAPQTGHGGIRTLGLPLKAQMGLFHIKPMRGCIHTFVWRWRMLKLIKNEVCNSSGHQTWLLLQPSMQVLVWKSSINGGFSISISVFPEGIVEVS